MARKQGFFGGKKFNPGAMQPGNMNNIMKQAQRMQRQMEEQKAAIEKMSFTGEAGGGAVKVIMNGKKEFTKVEISDAAFTDMDREDLETMFMAAANVAMSKYVAMSEGNMKELAGELAAELPEEELKKLAGQAEV